MTKCLHERDRECSHPECAAWWAGEPAEPEVGRPLPTVKEECAARGHALMPADGYGRCYCGQRVEVIPQ